MAQNASFCWKPAHNKKTNKQNKKSRMMHSEIGFSNQAILVRVPLREMFPAALRRAGRGVASYDFVVVGGGATGGDGAVEIMENTQLLVSFPLVNIQKTMENHQF